MHKSEDKLQHTKEGKESKGNRTKQNKKKIVALHLFFHSTKTSPIYRKRMGNTFVLEKMFC